MSANTQRLRKRVLTLLILLALLLVVAYRSLLLSVTLPVEGVKLKVPRGSTWLQVAVQLESLGVVSSRHTLRAYLWLRPGDEKLMPGVFIFKPPMTLEQVVARLAQQANGTPPLILIEGTRFSDLREQLALRDDLEQATQGLSDAQVLAAIGAPETHPEGLFAPDTYLMEAGDRDIDVLRRLYLRQQAILLDEWAQRDSNLPYRNPYDALIMASIIEKETGVADERAQIAGVFVRRLRLGMRLQTDPTVIYGMGDAYKGNIRRSDLRRPTPYNTYVIYGLPPTPIALPSRAAIHAALHPAPGTALYFVADGRGGHVFSDDLKSHNRAVNRYQR